MGRSAELIADARARVTADGKLQKLCERLRSRVELDAVLDADARIAADPELRAGVVSRILELVPRLRAN